MSLQTPRTPGTPQLGYAGSPAFSSPGSAFRVDDETFVFELGARHMQAGLAGEARPRCVKEFDTRKQKVAGDYSLALPHQSHNVKIQTHDIVEKWGDLHELWQMHAHSTDLGLMGDRIEKVIREGILHDLLVLDARNRQVILVLPTLLPHVLLSTILVVFFNLHPAPSSITLLPSPLSCTFAAGLRSSLVIDVGWHETVVYAIYDYREVLQKRSCRAMKLFGWEMNKLLQKSLGLDTASEQISQNSMLSFDETEDILMRMAWCRTLLPDSRQQDQSDQMIEIPIHSVPGRKSLSVPFSHFSETAETTFFATSSAQKYYDDHELPLHFLAYMTLLALPIDVRQACLPRIIIIGGGSKIPGLKTRLTAELSQLIATRGWDKVYNYGSAGNPPQRRTIQLATSPVPNEEHSVHSHDEIPAAQQPQISDADVINALRRRTLPSFTPRPRPPPTAPMLAPSVRVVETLGPWAGASLLAGLKVSGVVEIKREDFLKHGLGGAERKKWTASVETVPVRQPLLRRVTGQGKNEGESKVWSLGGWG